MSVWLHLTCEACNKVVVSVKSSGSLSVGATETIQAAVKSHMKGAHKA